MITTTEEPIEAVIISGPRKGDIVQFPPLADYVDDDDVAALNEALDDLILAMDRAVGKMSNAADALRLKDECS